MVTQNHGIKTNQGNQLAAWGQSGEGSSPPHQCIPMPTVHFINIPTILTSITVRIPIAVPAKNTALQIHISFLPLSRVLVHNRIQIASTKPRVAYDPGLVLLVTLQFSEFEKGYGTGIG